VAGLVAAGVYPSPVGYADVITFTTHKSLCGPRGAVILTTDRALARKIDRAVFPGEQGGPHINVFGAMALAFKLAQTDQFQQLQDQIIKNCAVFTDRLEKNGFRIPFGGTNTHLMNLDCSSVVGEDGTKLSGDQAARILDIAGIVVNRNTIPGDRSALDPSGIRMGTPWITQRGFKEKDMLKLADIITDILNATRPFALSGSRRKQRRAKVEFSVFERAKIQVRDMALEAGIDFDPTLHGYPHFYYLDDGFKENWVIFEISGDKVRQFLNYALTSDVESMHTGESQSCRINTPQGETEATLFCSKLYNFHLRVANAAAGYVATWLRDLSDGYIMFDEDIKRKLPGPIVVTEIQEGFKTGERNDPIGVNKPYFIGIEHIDLAPLPKFVWHEQESELRRTPLYPIHKQLGAKIIPFAGWEMPVWYTSVLEEHRAVREAAGVFDVSHMGVYQVEGPDASVFLDSVVGNDIAGLDIGESCYTHFLDPDANVIDDLLVYHRGLEKYMLVVNAANDEKDWAWLNAVKDHEIQVSNRHPQAWAFGRNAILRNLRDPNEGPDMRVDIALQGPRSRDILLDLGVDQKTRKMIMALKRTQLCEAIVAGFDLVISRTGYTGEKMAFELFVHPDDAEKLFGKIINVGETSGIKPIGLGARDSLRTEAGLPLYGHEMGEGSGHMNMSNLGVGDAGFGSYVKAYKPWFIGREAHLEREKTRKRVVVRFRFLEKGIRMAHSGNPILDKRGLVIGWVTSCAVDQDGFLTGQAYVDLKYAPVDTSLYIFQSASTRAGIPPADLLINDKHSLPTMAKVVKRFL
jgi:glycine hydroxymethyltransferase